MDVAARSRIIPSLHRFIYISFEQIGPDKKEIVYLIVTSAIILSVVNNVLNVEKICKPRLKSNG